MNFLPIESQKQIVHQYNTTSIQHIVKELVENSLDAESSSVSIKTISNGLDTIAIRDQGHGFANVDCLFTGQVTSKISEFDDVQKITTFGFRGQALVAISSISKSITVQTKTRDDGIGHKVHFENGKKTVTPVACNVGTEIVVKEPFLSLPVRRQQFTKTSHLIPKSIKTMIQQYYLNQFTKRFEYSNVDSKGSTTTSVFVAQKTLKDALMQTFGIETVQALQNLVAELDGYRIECWLPKSLDQKAWNSVAQYYIYANSKIISYSSNALFKDFISKIQKCFKTTKYPFLYLNIVVPLQDIDINVSPEKNVAIFSDEGILKDILDELICKGCPEPEVEKEVRIVPLRPLSDQVVDLQADTERSFGVVVQKQANSAIPKECDTVTTKGTTNPIKQTKRQNQQSRSPKRLCQTQISNNYRSVKKASPQIVTMEKKEIINHRGPTQTASKHTDIVYSKPLKGPKQEKKQATIEQLLRRKTEQSKSIRVEVRMIGQVNYKDDLYWIVFNHGELFIVHPLRWQEATRQKTFHPDSFNALVKVQDQVIFKRFLQYIH